MRVSVSKTVWRNLLVLVDDVKTKQTKALCPFNPTVVTHFDMFISVAAVVHMLAAVFCRQQLHPWPHPQVHACTRKAKPLTFVHMSAGGVLPTHCSALLERPEAQSGGRQDLGRTRVGGVGACLWCHSVGVGMRWAFWNLTYWHVSVLILMGDGKQQGNYLSRADLRQKGKRMESEEEKQVCHTWTPCTQCLWHGSKWWF